MDKPRKIWRIILVVSLAINVAIAGVLVGSAMSGRTKAGPPARVSFEFGPLGRVLDREDRRAIGAKMRRDGARPITRQEMNGWISELAAALRADPFDADGFAAMINGLQDRSQRVQQNAQAAFVAHLAAMTPEKRASLADRLDRK